MPDRLQRTPSGGGTIHPQYWPAARVNTCQIETVQCTQKGTPPIWVDYHRFPYLHGILFGSVPYFPANSCHCFHAEQQRKKLWSAIETHLGDSRYGIFPAFRNGGRNPPLRTIFLISSLQLKHAILSHAFLSSTHSGVHRETPSLADCLFVCSLVRAAQPGLQPSAALMPAAPPEHIERFEDKDAALPRSNVEKCFQHLPSEKK